MPCEFCSDIILNGMKSYTSRKDHVQISIYAAFPKKDLAGGERPLHPDLCKRLDQGTGEPLIGQPLSQQVAKLSYHGFRYSSSQKPGVVGYGETPRQSPSRARSLRPPPGWAAPSILEYRVGVGLRRSNPLIVGTKVRFDKGGRRHQ